MDAASPAVLHFAHRSQMHMQTSIPGNSQQAPAARSDRRPKHPLDSQRRRNERGHPWPAVCSSLTRSRPVCRRRSRSSRPYAPHPSDYAAPLAPCCATSRSRSSGRRRAAIVGAPLLARDIHITSNSLPSGSRAVQRFRRAVVALARSSAPSAASVSAPAARSSIVGTSQARW